MTAVFRVGDVFDRLAELPDGSVDVVITSPPFLALRSYLPADHPDKGKEIGSEATPAAFVDVLLAVTAELRRVLAPHGSIAVELGDTYAGSGGAGGDYAENGLREGQPRYKASDARKNARIEMPDGRTIQSAGIGNGLPRKGEGWPLAKSKALIPELYRIALAYGINPLTGQPSPAGQWRVRNVVTWCRPNPPVGALGDKWRPATSDVVVACVSSKRYWDDLATRTEHSPNTHTRNAAGVALRPNSTPSGQRDGNWSTLPITDDKNPAGAPLLDWWSITAGGYSGKTLSVHREPCGPDDGGERTTSPDCPEHGDQLDQAPTERCGERGGASSIRTECTDSGHAQALPLDSEPTDATPDHSGSSRLPTMETSAPECALAATTRSKTASRTAPAQSTSPADTPSVGTSPRTGDTPAIPSSGEHRLDTSESSISVVGSSETLSSQMADRTADTETVEASSGPCTCSYSKVVREEYTSHYAVFPPALVEPLVKAMAPPRVCRTCGEPSLNIDTLGFTDCGHDDWRPALILDPFAGSGTTLSVATGHGHDALGIDLDPRNADLALDRVGPLLLDVDTPNDHRESTVKRD